MTDDAQLDPPIGPDGRSITGDESSFETNDALRPDPPVRYGSATDDAAGGSAGDAPNAGYTGGTATGTESAPGMRQIVVDEAAGSRPPDPRGAGDDGDEALREPASNLAQQDQ